MGGIDLLPHRLKARRKELGLTLAQVGEHTDLSISFLSDIEVGRASPSLETLAKLAECYHTSVATLCAEFDEQAYERQVRKEILEKVQAEIRAMLEQ